MFGYKVVWSSIVLRGCFLILFLGGVAFSAVTSYFSLWAIQTFRIPSSAVAILFMISGITGIVANPILGFISDRFCIRRQMLLVVLCVSFISFTGLALVKEYSVAIPFIMLLGFGVMGPIMTIANVYMQSKGFKREIASQSISVIRQAWSIGYIVGPVIASVILIVAKEIHYVFLWSAVVMGVSIAIFLFIRKSIVFNSENYLPRKSRSEYKELFRRSDNISLLFFIFMFMAIVFIWIPGQTRTVYLPLLVTGEIGLNDSLVGPLISVFSIVMTCMLPVTGKLSAKVGAAKSLYVSALLGIIYCLLQSFSNSYAVLLMLQILLGIAAAMWNTGAILYIQERFPNRKGVADGFYAAVLQAPALFVGLIMGSVTAAFGIRAAFVAAAVCEAVGITILFLFDKLNKVVTSKWSQQYTKK